MIINGFVILFVFAILIALSFLKSPLWENVYKAACGIVAFLGAIGCYFSRELLLSNVATVVELEKEFVEWVLFAFDKFAFVSLSTALTATVCLIFIAKAKPKILPKALHQVGRIALVLQIGILLLCVQYSIGTINVLFDVAAYIGVFALSCVAILCAVYIAERKWVRDGV